MVWKIVADDNDGRTFTYSNDNHSVALMEITCQFSHKCLEVKSRDYQSTEWKDYFQSMISDSAVKEMLQDRYFCSIMPSLQTKREAAALLKFIMKDATFVDGYSSKMHRYVSDFLENFDTLIEEKYPRLRQNL